MSTPSRPLHPCTSSTRPTPQPNSPSDELDVADSRDQPNDLNLPRFSPSGLLSSLRGSNPKTESQYPSTTSKPRTSPQTSRATSRDLESSSSGSSSSSSSGSEDEESGGLGDLVRSLHESNETQSIRTSRRKRSKPEHDDTGNVRSRRTGSGSTMNRNGSRVDSLKSAVGSRLGKVCSTASGRTGTGSGDEEEDPGDGGLPTLNSSTRPPRPSPPLPARTRSGEDPSSIPPRFSTRPSSASALDPRRHLQQNHQDLNQPFIPEVPRQAQSLPRKIGGLVTSYLSVLDPGGRASMQQDLQAGTPPLNTIAALIATT